MQHETEDVRYHGTHNEESSGRATEGASSAGLHRQSKLRAETPPGDRGAV